MNFDRLDELAAQLRAMRPLNETELKRLREEGAIRSNGRRFTLQI